MENTIPKDLQLIAIGLTWRQSLAAIVVGNIIATGLLVINSILGMFYHIGFPLVNRYIWGLYGSLFVLWNWILLSINAVQAWIGGQCIYVSLRAIWPSLESRIPNHMPQSIGMTTAQFVAYIIFMVLSLPVLHIRPHKLQTFFYISSATVVIFEIVILIWALASLGDNGFGSTISELGTGGSGWKIAFGIVSTMGGAAAGILNQNDYTRFARTPRQAILGQLRSLWSTAMDGGSRSRVAAFFGGAALSVSQMGLNVPANALAGVSIACNPWKLSIFLGPMVGSMIASYFAVMRRKMKIEDLFPCHADAKGIYWYTYGVNWRAPVAWLCGMVPSLPGFVAHADPSVAVPVGLTRIYYICFLTGTAISAGVYTALHYIFPTPEVRAFVEEAPSPGILLQEYRLRWDRGSVNEIVEQVKP
ncbi:permease for cytosine/purines, uracil, thiamine, allantoin-domain-containing protein [Aspergillus transmontanensis]|uniref:Permease for cytosine/purines, uracil, thiamine, allantoin-domain-containing protein n=1 Tax=Aspergillus transmontanensis TaxID=1034304 RepID=A0A5N6WAY0_9EURO|nr:permease for cytosine/purines, uracil, thiamine, allantoin-domain-containing protein [Aspergillus transmontanensis]